MAEGLVDGCAEEGEALELQRRVDGSGEITIAAWVGDVSDQGFENTRGEAEGVDGSADLLEGWNGGNTLNNGGLHTPIPVTSGLGWISHIRPVQLC